MDDQIVGAKDFKNFSKATAAMLFALRLDSPPGAQRPTIAKATRKPLEENKPLELLEDDKTAAVAVYSV